MLRRIAATLAALALTLTIVTPALARTPGVERPDGWTNERALFLVCVGSISAQLHMSPTDPGVLRYCLAWLNGEIAYPPSH